MSVLCVEVEKSGHNEEVERLKRDKNVLMQELIRLRQQQQSTHNQLQTIVQRLQGMERRRHGPGFLSQIMQQQNERNRNISEANMKKATKAGWYR
ncbi:hypothetical protein GQ457_04G036900 [Hibiscus cannabinus]